MKAQIEVGKESQPGIHYIPTGWFVINRIGMLDFRIGVHTGTPEFEAIYGLMPALAEDNLLSKTWFTLVIGQRREGCCGRA